MYYVQDNGGISLWDDYPYTSYDNMCIADYYGPVAVENVYHVTGLSES